jgi:aryl-alcohol dehydrogenase-like predicted oxidoreductase
MNKFIIGTAQFGLNYGINNLNNKLQLPEMKLILNDAKKNDINFIDTAISYGNSEDNLGKIGVKDFKIISKLPKLPNKTTNVKSWVIQQAKLSIKKLNIEKLYGLLLHNPSDLFGPNGKNIIEALKELKLSRLVSKIGVSIYDPEELDDIFSLLKFDIVQSPLNIVDRRLINSGWLSRLNNKGVEVHARSIFLQGLLLIHRDKIPLKFERWSKIWDKWNLKLNNEKLNAVLVCMNFLLKLKGVDRIIIGVDSINQMKEIISLKNIEVPKSDWSFMESFDQYLINPTNWNKL